MDSCRPTLTFVITFHVLLGLQHWFVCCTTDFCNQPLGMKRGIIGDAQITGSSFSGSNDDFKGKNARLDSSKCWCSGSTSGQQWVKVDLRYPRTITGIKIQGNPSNNNEYIKEFKIKYSINTVDFWYYTVDGNHNQKTFPTGANGGQQTVDVFFPTKPIPARIFEFHPTTKNGARYCVRFELYGCSYVCEKGVGIEHGTTLPTGFIMTSSAPASSVNQPIAARLNGPNSWCPAAALNSYLQIDLGRVFTITGIATQGDPNSDSRVANFRFEYGTDSGSLVDVGDLFVGNNDKNTIVVNWFKVRLNARYVKIKPNGYNNAACMRIELMGCKSDSIYEIGAENRALEDSKFEAFASTAFFTSHPEWYKPHFGRLFNFRPWGTSEGKDGSKFVWFKVNLRRIMLVTAVATQGDGDYGPNYFPDFKLQHTGSAYYTIKQEGNSNEKIFTGNTNNAGVKINFLDNPITMKYIQFIKNSNVKHDYTLRVEVYGRPLVCTESFGMVAGEPSTNQPTVSVSSGTVPDKNSKINDPHAWCTSSTGTGQYMQYDFGSEKVISGFAVQGDPVFDRWIKTFKVKYGNQESSMQTYQEGGSEKTFTGGTSRDAIVYHWFSSNLKIRYLRINPLTWKTQICLRMNAYGCPKSGCYDVIGVQSSSTIADASITSSTYVSGNEAHKGRFNSESVWESCQTGSCSPRESSGSKPWIQVCLASIKKINSVIVQGQGNKDNIARLTEFSLKYGYSDSGVFYDYIYGDNLQVFRGPDGRYSTSQIDLPHSVFAKCLRLQVVSQSTSSHNVGLRWEILGCTESSSMSTVSVSPSSLSILRNGEGSLVCTVTAQPGVSSTWKKGNNPLSSSGIFTVENDVIFNSNVNGQTRKTLKITATPSVVRQSFSTCSVTDNVNGLVECKENFQCSAEYSAVPGSSKSSSTVEVKVTGIQAKPSMPSGFTVTSITNSSAIVSWNPSTADYPIQDYTATLKRKSDSSVISSKAGLTTTSTPFSGLSPYTEYRIEVTSKSASSWNFISNTGTHEFRTDEGVSSPPGGVSAIAVSSTSVNISWNEPAQLNGNLHNYRVKYQLENEAFSQPVDASNRQLQIGSLKPFRDYHFQVSATTKGGTIEGYWSSTATAKTLEGMSSPPGAVSAIPVSSTSINISWNEPSPLNGILHDYRVKYKLENQPFGAPLAVNLSANRRLKIGSLKPFKDYHFQVLATTKSGTILGNWSSIATAKTFEGIPTAPVSLEQTEILPRSLLLQWSKPAEENGIVRNYTVRYNGKKTYNASFKHDSSITVNKKPNVALTVANLTSLYPGTSYSIDVAATTGGGKGVFTSKLTITTTYAAPPMPALQNLGIIDSVTKLRLGHSWDINGPISEYKLAFVEGVNSLCPAGNQGEVVSTSKIPLDLDFKPGIKSVVGISTQLKTIANYTVCYRAVVKGQGNEYLGELAYTVIERKYLEKLDPKQYESQIKANTFVIPLAKGPADVKSYHIIVVETNDVSKIKGPDEWKPNELGPYDSTTYKPGKPYVTGVLTSFANKFEIGDGKEYLSSARRRRSVNGNKYVNVALKSDTEYVVFQRVYISQNKYYSSQWIGPLKTKKSVTKEPPPPTPPIGGIVAGVVVAIVLIAAVVAVWFLRKRNLSKRNDKELSEKEFVPLPNVTEQNDNLSYEQDEDEASNKDNAPPPEPKHHSFIHRRHSSAASLRHKKIPRAVGHDSHHPPISVQDFAKHSKHLQKDSHHGITVEFEDLIKGQQFPWDIAINAVNKPKNRYANIAAYDHSRVHLSLKPGVPHSDYFNANHISGYSGKPVYIASQGPVDAVLDDFWRMIWEKKVPAIIMVTNLFERGKKKCTQYWPDVGFIKYGDVTVTLVSSENYVDYAIRCFTVAKDGTKEVRDLFQYHYLTWPDHGIPEFPTDLLNLRSKFRRRFPYQMEEPVLVHCSAGVGRTGTFIVIDAMLELAQTEKKIDVFNYLNFIRSQRIHLIQVEEQYIFVYNALLEAITCGKTEIESHNLRIHINNLQAKDKSGKTGFEQQFKHLQLVTSTAAPSPDGCAGLKPANQPKNRVADIVPKDINRFMLQQSFYENSEDYINATYVNGYKKKNAFIATQHPLPDTIDDFWNMIQQGDVATIILLNRLKDGPETLPCFWPALEETEKYGNVYVYTKSESDEGYAIERKFLISLHSSFEDSVEITVFHFQSWPDHSVPKDYSKLLTLISNLEKCQQQQNDDQPVVVMCRDGAGRTGTFIAITAILERFKTEQLIDVFQTIKKLRAFRPQFVENTAQFKFCYSIIQAYMDSFDTYANFTG